MDFENFIFDLNDFDFAESQLGQGTYGEVYIATRKDKKESEDKKDSKDSKEKYAAKIINSGLLETKQDQIRFLRESMIMSQLNHPGVVKFAGINLHSFKDLEGLNPTILTEYHKNGSLDAFLKKKRRNDLTQKYIFLIGIADAMRYLHQHKVIHRDLKPANILVDSNYYPCICDFGQSKYFSNINNSVNNQMTISNGFGTPKYTAPEVIDADDDMVYNESIDVYSYAIIAYEIVTEEEAFKINGKQINHFNLCKNVAEGKRPEFPKNTPDKIKDLINRCWSQNPKERPSFDEIYDELVSDFTYLGDKKSIDVNEIQKYINHIKIEQEYQNYGKNNPKDYKESIYSNIIKTLLTNSSDINDEIMISKVLF